MGLVGVGVGEEEGGWGVGEEEGEVGWARVLGEGLFVLGFFLELVGYVVLPYQVFVFCFRNDC